MAVQGSTLIFGGRGMVGAAICRELARRGAGPIASLGRSEDAAGGALLDSRVEQKSGIDALRPETFSPLLKDAKAVVISMGLPPWVTDREKAISANGSTCVSVLKAASEHKVPRIVLLSATMPEWGIMKNYREGKNMADEEARKYVEACGVDCTVLIMKPSVVSGTRYVGSVPLPLWIAMAPMRFFFRTFASPCQGIEKLMPGLFGGILRPAVYAEELAMAAADAIESAELKGLVVLGTDELVGYKSNQA